MWHQHKIDAYFGALFITVLGAAAVLFIVHTIETMPAEAFMEPGALTTLATS